MATVMDIIQGISQAAANAYDGSHDDRVAHDGEGRKVGLKREKGDLNLEARVMDGFKIRFFGDKLCVLYHSEMNIKEIHDKNRFESDIEQMLADIASYLKKEYKKITGDSLTLTKDGEVDIFVSYMNNVRSWVQAKQFYKIGGLKEVLDSREPESEDRLDQAIKNWLELGKKSPKPKNVTVKQG